MNARTASGSRVRRPTAFEASFGEPMEEEEEAPRVGGKRRSESAEERPGKRANQQDGRRAKQQQRQVIRYAPQPGEVPESNNPLVLGEELDDASNERPIRVLSDFVFFDPAHQLEMLSLAALEADDSMLDRQFEGAGFVCPHYDNEEDGGQEDEDEEFVPVRMRLSAVLTTCVDYTVRDDPIYITTSYAWYMLRIPFPAYSPFYTEFYRVQKALQALISTAVAEPDTTPEAFFSDLSSVRDEVLGRPLDERDIRAAVPLLSDAIETASESGAPAADQPNFVARVQASTKRIVAPILAGRSIAPARLHGAARTVRNLTSRKLASLPSRDPDIAVLKAENQNPTHVTPRIALLARGLFREQLVVVGPRPAHPTPAVLRRRQQDEHALILRFIAAALRDDPPVRALDQWRLGGDRRSPWLKKVKVGDEEYSVGDVIVVPIGKDEATGKTGPDLPDHPRDVPEDAMIADYFWFAKVISINFGEDNVHVQWFEHSSKTMLEDVSDARELFLTKICNNVGLKSIAGKVEAIQLPPSQPVLEPGLRTVFYYKFVYDKKEATFMDIPPLPVIDSPPDNCMCCAFQEQVAYDEFREIENGIMLKGFGYHIHDFVYIRSSDGPCKIGQITSIARPKRARDAAFSATVRRLGLFGSLSILPPGKFKDERELFLTDEEETVSTDDLIQVCYVAHGDVLEDKEAWCQASPDHFYVRFHFSKLSPCRWGQHRQVAHEELLVCSYCLQEKIKEQHEWKQYALRPLLSVFDPFAGVGALSQGLESAGGIKTTHAVEISPSAAITFRKNSSNTVVYNQCANEMLRYTIKYHKGLLDAADQPKHLSQEVGLNLPSPPKPGSIDILAAGFPCQPHSCLNMFQKANDVKSNLLLTLLSLVDELQPKYCVFENVKGFLQFNLNSVQHDQFRTEDGIEMGGLKVLIRILVAMNYQVRFGLLQAGHYGTPQGRIRFFLIAARTGFILPNLPQPTHDFPIPGKLEIKFSNSDSIQPIITERGTAPLLPVTVNDAISDLPRFDWLGPDSATQAFQAQQRVEDFPTYACDSSKTHVGIEGKPTYYSKPLNTFQQKSRRGDVSDIQHFTRVLRPEAIERVIHIPLIAGADYRSLKSKHWEWQFSNPSSAVARGGFRAGLYGRIDKDGFFITTVTNMEPTAKQCKVLNPYCMRTVTVRELARSQGFPDHFEFYSLNNSVKTMHRQIGNAVPWPVGAALGREIRLAEFKRWKKNWQEATHVDD